MKSFFEKMYFSPKWYHNLVIILLFPFSVLYGSIMYLRRKFAKSRSYDIPIISVGNLIVGGSGKTPFVIALAMKYSDVTIVSRGYGRESSGLVEVSQNGKILTDVSMSGDEAMLMALSLPHASVMVSEDRDIAIKKAILDGSKIILLDDGFNRVEIKKFEILLEPDKIKNNLPFPSGPFREFASTRCVADIVAKEQDGFSRSVVVIDATARMLLVTAIANPQRLNSYLPDNVIGKVTYDDHAYFDETILVKLLEKNSATSILCTSKDRVKMVGFKLPISEMKLKLQINTEILTQIDAYIEGFNNEK